MHASVEAVPLMRSENKTTVVFRKHITFDMAEPKVATISIQERFARYRFNLLLLTLASRSKCKTKLNQHLYLDSLGNGSKFVISERSERFLLYVNLFNLLVKVTDLLSQANTSTLKTKTT